MAGAVWAQTVGEAAAIFSAVMMLTIIPQIGVIGLSAGRLTRSVPLDVIDLPAVSWL